MKRIIVAASMALVLGACATASNPGAMVADLTESNIISEDSKLANAVTLESVSGGQETNPLWTSQVSDSDFAEALRQSLAAHAILATDEGDYKLTAELEKLKQPVLGGFNMSVTSDVKYTLTSVETGEVVYEDMVSEKYTAQMGDAFMGVERLRLANEGSIKQNISTMLTNLIAEFDGQGTDSEGGEAMTEDVVSSE